MSILKTAQLKKYYGAEPNLVRALDGVDVEINAGEFVSIVGTRSKWGSFSKRASQNL